MTAFDDALLPVFDDLKLDLEEEVIPVAPEVRKQVEEILVKRLGHKVREARQMIEEAIKRHDLEVKEKK